MDGEIMDDAVAFGRDEVISRKKLLPFTRRTDWFGLVYLSVHLGTIAVTGWIVHLSLGTVWMIPAMFCHGIVVTFLYGPLHECSHGTAFRSRWLNETVFKFCNLVYISTPLWYRYKHANHHTYTQINGKDMEMVLPSPATFWQYVLQCTGITFWRRNLGALFRHAGGRTLPSDAAFFPKDQLARNYLEARINLAIYAAIAIVALAAESWAPLVYWLIPRVLAEPVMRSIRVVEHTGCEEGPDLRKNTRTTRMNPLLTFFFWNMPYHAEHHICPAVPFHKLPAFHREIGNHLKQAPGILTVHWEVLRDHLVSASEPTVSQTGS